MERKETKETIEKLLDECEEMLASGKIPVTEDELVESPISSSFEFGYICGALRRGGELVSRKALLSYINAELAENSEWKEVNPSDRFFGGVAVTLENLIEKIEQL